MSKHSPAIIISFIVFMAFGYSVNLSSSALRSGHWAPWLVSIALAEESSEYGSDGYSSDGYDAAGYDRDGYNREGYTDEGHTREGDYDAEHDSKSTASGTAPTYKAKPVIKQY